MGVVARGLYFAYGSNMCTRWLRGRVRSARPLFVTSLPGYALRFIKISKDGSAKCTIVRDRQSVVQGVLFEIEMAEKQSLDRAEGVRHGYEERQVVVRAADGTEHDAFTYAADESAIDVNALPYTWYKKIVVAGAEEHALPSDYIECIASTESIRDPNRRREQEKLSQAGLRPSDEV